MVHKTLTQQTVKQKSKKTVRKRLTKQTVKQISKSSAQHTNETNSKTELRKKCERH